MIGHRDPPHMLTQLGSTTTPKRLLFLDCHSQAHKQDGMFVRSWSCGALGTTHYTSRLGVRTDETIAYQDPTLLWGRVDDYCKANRRTVLWSYDLATQLRIGQGLLCLPKLGWTMDRIVLERAAAWASFTYGKRSLLLCDLKAWAPVEFGTIVSDLAGIIDPKPSLKAGPDLWADTCKWRVGVVREAVLQILGWIEGENLGPFRPTGSGQSYAAFRRRFHHTPLLVHDDMERLQAERAAMWTGRCEAWQHGHLNQGPYVEYDMQAAYCRIAAECDVPTQAHGVTYAPSVKQLQAMMKRHAVLAKLEVTTDVPCLPTRMGERTAWPVGHFRTWLWDSEVRLALETANKVRVLQAYTYHRGPAIRDFATWTLQGLGDQEQVYGRIPKRVLKHWSRCLVGRLGLRYRAWEKFATGHDIDLRLMSYVDTEDGSITDMLIAGHDWLILTDMQEALESLPQIPSWVMSECRARLWSFMNAIDIRRVVYVDTDSIIVDKQGSELVPAAESTIKDIGWTIKGQYNTMTIYGPRNYVANDMRKVSGLPRSARQIAPLEFTGHIMKSIKESMKAGQLDCVVDVPRTFKLDALDLRRQHLPNGQTAPFTVQLPNQSQEDY